MEIAALGARSRAVFAASRRVARIMAGRPPDVVVTDTAAAAAAAAGVAAPAVVLAESPPLLSVPAFDLLQHNPIGWRREVENGVGALGPLDRLPPGCRADRVVNRHDRPALGEIHHLEDVAAFHGDPVSRAGELVRLAAMGVVVHLADGDKGDRRLAPYLGAELFELMTREARDLSRDLDIDGRESLSVRMRRAALREHSLTSRARQVAEHAALPDPPRLPLVSILLVTQRPELLDQALATVRRQTYPRLELILGLHGEGFGEVAPAAAGPAAPMTVLRRLESLPLGSVLNAATQAARGTLLAKMDDDDLYGPDHIWDLVLAHEYSQASLVGKGDEFVYLAASDRTVRRLRRVVECYETIRNVAGGALLIERHLLDRIGGWKRQRRWVDQALIQDSVRAGVHVYRTHPYGYLLTRHGRRRTGTANDAWFLAQAAVEATGFRPDLAGIGGARYRAPRTAWGRLLARLRNVDSPAAAWRLVHWLPGTLPRVLQLLRRLGAAPSRASSPESAARGRQAGRPAPATPIETPSFPARGAPASPPRAEYPLGVEIAALGAMARAVFAASRRVARTADRQHLDMVVADTAADAPEAAVPVVALAEAPPMLSVPAFDPRTDNPIGWQREVGNEVGALGPLHRLPAGCEAHRVVGRDDRSALMGLHHLEDVSAFHGDPVTRAGELVRLAATGVVVHLADGDADGEKGGRRLAPYLGAELFELMTRDVRDLGRDLDMDGRESLSVRMRRAALREHSLASRARQVAELAALPDPPRLPLVSILLPTRRPELLDRVLATVRRQTYPRLELVLGLHGKGFGDAAPVAAGPSTPVTALRLDASLPLGSVLNALTDAARGTLLAKMDDDDLYGPEYIWDLVLAHEYSQAPLVGNGGEFVYLDASNRTIRRVSAGSERFDTNPIGGLIAGGALLIDRRLLDRVGGWKRVRRGEDEILILDTWRAGAPAYRTHSYGFLVIRHGRRHTWKVKDDWFLARSDVDKAGFRPDLAGIDGMLYRAPRLARGRLRARSRKVARQLDGQRPDPLLGLDPGVAWQAVRRFAGALQRRALRPLRRFGAAGPRPAGAIRVEEPSPEVRGASASSPRAEHPLGVEIAALGVRSRAVFAASRRVARPMAVRHVDVAVADTAAEAARVPVPAVVLADSPPMLSVPAFDPRTDNPIGWRREVESEVGALGPLDRLPPGCRADRVVNRHDRAALRDVRHLEDVAAFHVDPVSRAGELVRLAAMGVVVHLADGDWADGDADGDEGGRRLAPYVGSELFELMTGEAPDLCRELDIDGRESLSVRMRRAALREHSLTSRARQVAEHAALPDPPRLPLVSILLPTRRPELLDRALASVRRQTYPRLELVLGLHGEGFGEAPLGAGGLSTPVTALRLDASWPLGSVLNAMTDAAGGTLLARMDDDHLYGPDHIRDLVLAQEYSQAPLVGKGSDFVYLAASDRTVRRFTTGGERYGRTDIAGAALLIERHLLDRIGGWRRCPRSADQALIHEVVRAGASVYRTHPYGFLVIRHGRNTWAANDAWFLAPADADEAGWHPEWAGIGEAPLPCPSPPNQLEERG